MVMSIMVPGKLALFFQMMLYQSRSTPYAIRNTQYNIRDWLCFAFFLFTFDFCLACRLCKLLKLALFFQLLLATETTEDTEKSGFV